MSQTNQTQSAVRKQSGDAAILKLVIAGVMAAIIYVVTMFRIPLGQSKVHFANSMCLLGGLLLGPVWGGSAAGLGSALYDVIAGGYGIVEALITFVSKFAMGWVAGFLFRVLVIRKGKQNGLWVKYLPQLVISCVAGALTYVALYMLKTWIFKTYVEPVPVETIPAVMVGKLIPSLINAAFAVVTAPIFYHAIRPALKSGGMLKTLEGD